MSKRGRNRPGPAQAGAELELISVRPRRWFRIAWLYIKCHVWFRFIRPHVFLGPDGKVWVPPEAARHKWMACERCRAILFKHAPRERARDGKWKLTAAQLRYTR